MSSKRLAPCLCALAAIALPACDTWSAIAAAEAADGRHRASIAAELEIAVAIACTPQGAPRFASCGEQVALVFTHTQTNETHTLRVTDGVLRGALAEGEYELSVHIDGMRMGLSWLIGSVHLHAGTQRLGALEVRFVELAGGTFEAQAHEAERVRGDYGMATVDFLSSPTRGLLLIDARLEGGPS